MHDETAIVWRWKLAAPSWARRVTAWWVAAAVVAGTGAAVTRSDGSVRVDTGAGSSSALRSPSLPGKGSAATTIPPVTVPPVTVPVATVPPVTLPPVTLPPVTVPDLLGLIPDVSPVTITGSGLWLVDAEAGTGRRVLTGMAVQTVSFAPDGALVAFTAHETDDYDGRVPTLLAVLDVASGEVRRLVPDTRTPQAVQWSPDGQWIAFSQFPDPEYPATTGGDLWVVRPDGSDLRRLAPCDGGWGLRWSPDSRSIAQGRPNLHDVMVVDVASGETRSYPANGSSFYAEWAEGGSALIASGQEAGTVRIDVASGLVTPLSDGYYARPSPNGRWLATSTGGPGSRVEVGVPGGPVRDVGAGVPVDWSSDDAWLSVTPHTGAVHVVDALSGQSWLSATGDGVHMLSPTVWAPTGRQYLVIASAQTAFYAP